MATLLAEYDAVFVGAGTYRSMKAGLPNEEAPGSTMRCRSSSPTPNR
jgi:NADPH-dependent glutamate synthase beta subunit-like oxidoreductase